MKNEKIIPFKGGDSIELQLQRMEPWDALKEAAEKVAPVWPLENFVAVNPYLGLTGQTWQDAAAELRATAGATSCMSLEFYIAERKKGRLNEEILRETLLDHGIRQTPQSWIAKLSDSASSNPAAPLISDQYAELTGINASTLVIDQISKWCADYFDKGQAGVRVSKNTAPLFSEWLVHQKIDRSLSLLGMNDLAEHLSNLLPDAQASARRMLMNIGVAAEYQPLYLHRLARSIGGWLSYARFIDWSCGLNGEESETAATLLTVRLAYDWYCFKSLAADMGQDMVRQKLQRGLYPSADSSHRPLMILQEAFEKSMRQSLVSKFTAPQHKAAPATNTERPKMQAAFCIDVRSEIYRRALETQDPAIETIGFAGFFGLAADVKALSDTRSNAHCPVLLKPGYQASETPVFANKQALEAKQQAASANWFSFKAFKSSAVSSFAFVEALGLGYLGRTLSDAFRASLPAAKEKSRGLGREAAIDRLTYELKASDGSEVSLEERTNLAKNILAGMSLRQQFAPLVFLVGHGSSSVNNPHAAGLDCGACGGNAGAPNAQIAADLLNDPDVRAALSEHEINIPDDTLFLAGLHDTTTDEITFLGTEKAPDGQAANIEAARAHFKAASALTRSERSLRMKGVASHQVALEMAKRSRDWSEVRPEWGLAGCKAFIAAPRACSAHTDLAGHAFLHSYSHEQDDGFGVLELIMTAPMIVASWINLQYFGSTVDNHIFGSGNKALHNVVGKLGVLEGNGGDLRVGLPMQSLHDGENWMHDPVRLSVVIRAPMEAMNAVIEKHSMVRDLVDNGWLHLYAMSDAGVVTHEYAGDCAWSELDRQADDKSMVVA